MTKYPFSTALQDFVRYLRAQRLGDLTVGYMRRIKEADLPIMRFVTALPEDQQVAINRASFDQFLATLEDGTAYEAQAEGLRRWEADEIPGFSKHDFELKDLLLVGLCHEGAMIDALPGYTQDMAVAVALVLELRTFYQTVQMPAYQAFSNIRDEAVARATLAEAEREAATRLMEETQALNEELVAQQEELNTLYGQLQAHAATVEAEVARRTEELQAANEEMEAHHEELLAANDQLHQQAAELAKQNAFIENLVKHVPTGIAYMDRAHVFQWVNPEFASFANLNVAAFHGRSYYELFPHMENPNPRLTAVLESGKPAQITGFAASRPGGPDSYWDMVYVPVFDAAGQVEGLLLMSQNATARVRNEQFQQDQIDQLQEVDRLKNDFLSILSHELRTPINAIMGFASILDDELAGTLNERQHAYAQHILSGADILLALIEDLLDMSRIQAGKFSLNPAAFAPRPVIEEALAGLTQLAEQRGQRIALTVEGELAPLVADQQRLRQVLTNLLGNAIKFGAEKDTIQVRVRMDPEGLHCEVEDHGEGIAAADIPKLFRRFTQLDTGNARKALGAGLGLSIVKALAEAHGGEAGVRSEPGVRTVFWFRLPLEPSGAASVSA